MVVNEVKCISYRSTLAHSTNLKWRVHRSDRLSVKFEIEKENMYIVQSHYVN